MKNSWFRKRVLCGLLSIAMIVSNISWAPFTAYAQAAEEYVDQGDEQSGDYEDAGDHGDEGSGSENGSDENQGSGSGDTYDDNTGDNTGNNTGDTPDENTGDVSDGSDDGNIADENAGDIVDGGEETYEDVMEDDASDEDERDTASGEGPAYAIYVNGQPNQNTVFYNTDLEFRLLENGQPIERGVEYSFFYIKKSAADPYIAKINDDSITDAERDRLEDILDQQELTGEMHLNPDQYYLTYYTSDTGRSLHFNYLLTVRPVKLVSPSGLSLAVENDPLKVTAKWTAPNKDEQGKGLILDDSNRPIGQTMDSSALAYKLSVYKNKGADPVYTETISAADASENLSKDITSVLTSNGYGSYSFKISALLKDKSDQRYQESDTVALADGDAYDYVDTVAPTVSAYAVNSDKDGFTAHVSDDVAVKFFAFTTSAAAPAAKASTWQEIPAAQASAGEFDFTWKDIENSGKYYLHIADAKYNTASTANALSMTKVTLRKQNGEADETKKLFGNEAALTLPSDLSMTGSDFDGWYETQSPTPGAASITKVVISDGAADPQKSGSTLTIPGGADFSVYAVWSGITLVVDLTADKTSVTYAGDGAGAGITFTAQLKNSRYPTNPIAHTQAEYRWYRKGAGEDVAVEGFSVDGENDLKSTLKITDVSQSGTYYAKITIQDGESAPATFTSSEVAVTILPRDLHLTVANKTIAYKDPVPTDFALANNGNVGELIAGDLAGDQITGFTTTYTQGSNAGTYPIQIKGTVSGSNYNVIPTSGTLTVERKASDLEGFFLVDGEPTKEFSASYIAAPIEPAVVAYDGETLIDNTGDIQYAVTYENNVNASTDEEKAIAIITFKSSGNYAGTLRLPFAIEKDGLNPVVKMKDAGGSVKNSGEASWIFGNTADALTPFVETLPTTSEPEFYYAKQAAGDTLDRALATTTRPTDAGAYNVWAYIPADPNYSEAVSAPFKFEIKPRKITLTAGSQDYEYDGKLHSYHYYTQDGTFVEPDGFKSIQITGSIQNVGEAENTIAYELTPTTKASNYEIENIPGLLRMTGIHLTTPSGFGWDTGRPGTVHWIPIAQSNLTIEYKISLFRDTTSNEVATATVSGSEYDFASAILADSAAHGQAGYFVQITSIPKEVAGQSYANYQASIPSSTGKIYTAKIVLGWNADSVESVSFDEEGAGKTSVYLLEGTKVDAYAVIKYGYHNPVWKLVEASHSSMVDMGTDGETNTISLKTIGSAREIDIRVFAEDEKPEIVEFKAENYPASGYDRVKVTVRAYDKNGMSGYAIVRADTYDEAVTKSQSVDSFTAFDAAPVEHVYSTSEVLQIEAGKYYLVVKDSAGNLTVGADDQTIDVYKIHFDNGKAPEEMAEIFGGSMNDIYKVSNTSIVLPANAFTKVGSAFTGWAGLSGAIYNDGATYAANASDELKAQWDDATYSYRVDYYYANTNGTYDGVTPESKTFSGSYSVEITSSTPAILQDRTGFTRDEDPSRQSSVILGMTDSPVVSIYYARNQHRMNYSYTTPDGVSVEDFDLFYYGQEYVLRDPVEFTGYTFLGWKIQGFDANTKTMPARDLNVVGSFTEKGVEYHVTYYLQNLPTQSGSFAANNYAEVPAQTYAESVGDTQIASAKQGTVKTVSFASVDKKFDGFTLAAASVTRGGAGGSSAPIANTATSIVDGSHSITGTVDEEAGNELYINYYYTRDTYNVKLTVWKDKRDIPGNSMYEKTWTVSYGRPFTEEETDVLSSFGYSETLSENKWIPDAWKEGDSLKDDYRTYMLAEYTGWSSGSGAPTSMPAGPVNITKEYIRQTSAKYVVEYYFQTVDVDTGDEIVYPSKPSKTVEYYDLVGKKIVLQNERETDVTGSTVSYINYVTLGRTVDPDFDYFVLDESHPGNHFQDYVVKNSNGNVMKLKIYFKRTKVPVRMTYYYQAAGEGAKDRKTIVSYYIWKPWGSKLQFSPTEYFYGNTPIPSGSNATTEKPAEYDGVHNITHITPGLASPAVNYNDLHCQISYGGRYYSGGTRHWENKTFTKQSDVYNTTTDTAETYEMTVGPETGGDYYNYINIIYTGFEAAQEAETYFMKLTWNDGGDDLVEALVPTGENTYGQIERVMDFDDKGDPLYSYNRYTKGSGTASTEEAYNSATKYHLRIANKRDLFNTTVNTSGDATYPKYKVEALLNKATGESSFTYEGLKSKYTEIKVYTGSNYTKTPETYYLENGTNNIYILNPSNSFFSGNYIQYDVQNVNHAQNAAMLGLADAKTRVTFGNRATRTTTYGVHHVSDGGAMWENPDCFVYYQEAMPKQKLTLNYDGRKAEKYVEYGLLYNNPINDPWAQHSFPGDAGYEIVWYEDAGFTKPVASDATYSIRAAREFYGRREKRVILNHEYISYELPAALQESLGTEYLTASNYVSRGGFPAGFGSAVEAMTGSGREIVHDTISRSYEKEGGGSVTYDANRYRLYIDGEIVLTIVEHKSLSFTTITLPSEDYERVGFVYSAKDSNNITRGYCQTEAISLQAFFKRIFFTLDVYTPNPEVEGTWTVTNRTETYGIRVTVEPAEKEGYAFAGWTVTDTDTSAAVAVSSIEQYAMDEDTGRVTFLMPAINLTLKPIFTADHFDYAIPYFFQKGDGHYDTTVIAKAKAARAYDASIVLLGQSAKAGTLYKNGTTPIAASYTEGDVTYYFINPVVDGGNVNVKVSNLAAAEQTVPMVTDEEKAVGDYLIDASGFGIFSYAFTSYETKTENKHLSETSATLRTNSRMTLEYYFTRSAKYDIRTLSLATDSTDEEQTASGLSISGDGEYYHGEMVTLSAIMQKGYVFRGWFEADDILPGYTGVSSDLSSYTHVDLDALESAVSIPYTETVKGQVFKAVVEAEKAADYIAVSTPTDFSQVKVTLSIVAGNTNYTYGYAPSTKNYIQTKVSVPSAYSKKVSVTGYQWYKVSSEYDLPSDSNMIAGATGSTYLIPAGLDAGTHYYRCIVSLRLTENGRTAKQMTETAYPIVIKKFGSDAKKYYTVANYNALYDGNRHSIGVHINTSGLHPEKYEIYYSQLPMEDWDSVESGMMSGLVFHEADNSIPEEVSYKDVEYDEGGAVKTHEIYYYIHTDDENLSPNYADEYGSATVTIRPITITLARGAKPFEMMYNASEAVTGEDLERLINGEDGISYYKILNGSVLQNETGWKLSFDANYNNKHVDKANVITLSNIQVVDEEGNRNTNYNVGTTAGYTCSVAGYIVPYELAVEWQEETTFEYDAQSHVIVPHLLPGQTPPDAEVEVTASGEQKNVGTYKATAVLKTEGKEYQSGDYIFDLTTKTYEIVKCPITIAPKADEVEYNGNNYALTEYEITRDGVTADVNDDGTSSGLFAEQKIQMGSLKTTLSAKNVGVHASAVKEGTVKIYEGGVDITYNYDITYAEADLTIVPKPVTLEGALGQNKKFDATKVAALETVKKTYSGVEYDVLAVKSAGKLIPLTPVGMVAGDEVAFDYSKISNLLFDVAKVGYGRNITFEITEDALVGASAANYSFDVAGSDLTAAADITKSEVKVKIQDLSEGVIYGETPAFSISYEGFLGGDDQSVVTGTPTYTLTNGSTTKDADFYLDGEIYKIPYVADGYKINLKPDEDFVDGLAAEDYCFIPYRDGGYQAKLNIIKRPVTISGINRDEIITKEYDGTVNVTTALTKDVDYAFDAASGSGADAKGELTGDNIEVAMNTAYNSKNVTEADTIQATAVALAASGVSKNYTLTNDTFSVNGEITVKAVSIVADDKAITYGDAAPTYTVKAQGYVASDQAFKDPLANDLVTLTCEYDTSNAEKRGVDTYPITISNLTDTNYVLDPLMEVGELTVNKKEITVTTEDKTVTYGHIPDDDDDSNETNYSRTFTGWVEAYGDSTESVLGTQAGNASSVLTRVAEDSATRGTHDSSKYPLLDAGYDVKTGYVDGKELTSDNYSFKYVDGKLYVTKQFISIAGLATIPRVYNAGATLAAANVDYTGATVTSYLEGSPAETVPLSSFLPAGETITGNLNISGAYRATAPGVNGDGTPMANLAAKDAGTGKNVSFTTFALKSGSYMSSRYSLLTTEAQVGACGIDGAEVSQTTTTDGVITKRPVTIQVYYDSISDAKLHYGDTVDTSKFSWAVVGAAVDTGFIGKTGSTSDGTLKADGSIVGLKGKIQYSLVNALGQEYTSSSDAGTYYVTQTGDLSGMDTNYDLAIVGTGVITDCNQVTVETSQLAAPTVTFDTDRPGTITWEESPSIGRVDVEHYVLKLYKDADPAPVKTEIVGPSVDREKNWADAIRGFGPGKYTIQVQAIAATEEGINEVNQNVIDSEISEDSLYVANVSVSFAANTVTDEATAKAGSQITLNDVTPVAGKSTYTVISGETLPIAAQWCNANGYNTGYAIDQEPEGTGVTLSEKNDGSAAGQYSANAKIVLNSDADIDMTLSLKKRPATAVITIAAVDGRNEVPYDFLAEDAPMFEAKAATEATDNLTISGDDPEEWPYTYTYNWQYNITGTDFFDLKGQAGYTQTNRVIMIDPDVDPRLKAAYYRLKCTVTATRKDNGETVTVSTDKRNAMIIRRAVIGADKTKAIVDNWTYGETRGVPKIVPKSGVGAIPSEIGVITYYFRPQGAAQWTEWNTSTYPKDAGTYELYASVAASDNYDAFNTLLNITEFSIAKTKLGMWAKDPAIALTNGDLQNLSGDRAHYGLVTMKEVFAPKENGDSETDYITPTYEIKLYVLDEDGECSSLVNTYHDVDVDSVNGICTVDVTSDMNSRGKYYVTLQIYSDQPDNCEDSELFTTLDTTAVDAAIVTRDADGNTLHVEHGEVSYIYDGRCITMSVGTYDNTTYQWYVNGVTIPGAVDSTYEIKYVEDSAYYSCRMTYNDEQFDSNIVKETICPREITIASNSAQKPYDTTALTCHEWKIMEADGTETPFVSESTSQIETETGNTVSGVIVTGTKTNVSLDHGVVTSSDNTMDLTEITITEPGGKVVYNAAMEEAGVANYAITSAPGTLTINKIPLIITSESATKTYNGIPLIKHDLTTGENGESDLVAGDSVSVNYTGTVTDVQYDTDGQTVVGVDNTYDTVVITNSDMDDVTNSYDITCKFGSLKIEPKDETGLLAALTDAKAETAGDYDWTGSAITPTVQVQYLEMILEEGRDYELTGDTSAKNVADDYSICVQLKGNYTGTIDLPWKIVDVTAPAASVKYSVWDTVFASLLEKITFGLYHNDSVTVNLKGTEEDGGSGMSSLSYHVVHYDETYGRDDSTEYYTLTSAQLDEISDWTTPADLAISGDLNEIATGSFEIPRADLDVVFVYVKAVDLAGHVTYACSNGLIIDTVPVTATGVAANTEYCHEQTLNVSDRHLNEVKVNGVLVTPDASGNITIAPSEEVQTITATDKAGNVTEIASVKVNGRHTFVYDGNNTSVLHTSCELANCVHYGVDNMTVSVTAADGTYTGLAQTANVDISTEYAAESELENTVGSVQYFKTENAGEITGGVAVTEPVDAGHYYALVPVTGKYNNESYRVVVPYSIAPRDASDLTAELTDANSGTTGEYDWTGSNVEPTEEVKYGTTVLVRGTDYDISGDTARKDVADDYEMTITLKGNYTGTMTLPWKVVDVTAPGASVKFSAWDTIFADLLTKITFGLYHNDTVTVNLKGEEEDGGSGMDALSYYVARYDSTYGLDAVTAYDALTETQLDAIDSWITPDDLAISGSRDRIATGSFEIPKVDLDLVVVYVKAVDKAGHVSYACSNGLVIDSVPVELTGVSANTAYCHEQTVHVSDRYLDEVLVDGEIAIPDASGNITLAPSETAHTIEAKDLAGNVTTIANVKIKDKHTFVYEGSDTTELYTKCDLPTCAYYHVNTLNVKVTALDGIYDGAAHPAEVLISSEYAAEPELDETVGQIAYYKTEDAGAITGGVALAGTEPVDAGHYYATVPIAGKDGQNYRVVVPYSIAQETLTSVSVANTTLIYDGTELDPGDIQVFANVNGVSTLLTLDRDYVLTDGDTENRKQLSAVKPGTYTVEATGIGNFEGTVICTYTIVDDVDPVIETLLADGSSVVPAPINCKPINVKVTDANLTSVEILTKNGGVYGEAPSGAYSLTSGTLEDGEMVYTLAGSEEGTEYQIKVVDASDNTTTVSDIKVYTDHLFENYIMAADHNSKTAICEHGCGISDEAVLRWGTVEWTYDFDYYVEEEHFTGTQMLGERSLYAKVELQRKGIHDSDFTAVASTIVDCTAECGPESAAPAAGASAKYEFLTYDPADPNQGSGPKLIPALDEEGNPYTYRLAVKPGKMTGSGTFREEAEYKTTDDTQDYSAYPDSVGFHTLVEYAPNSFYLPWKITLNQEEPYPEYLYVKVICAESADADDTEGQGGYETVAQQAGAFDLGQRCDAVVNADGTVSYEGRFAVNKFLPSSTNCYYYRIQITGAAARKTDGTLVEYDLTEKGQKSGNEADQKVHFDVDHNGASGIIDYQPEDLPLPVVWLESNEGQDRTNLASVTPTYILADAFGGSVTEAELAAVSATREHYELGGWFDAQINGNLISSVDHIDEPKRIYAHWIERLAPTGKITVGTNEFTTFLNTITLGMFFKKTVDIKITAEDDANEFGVTNSGINAIYYNVHQGDALTLADMERISWTKGDHTSVQSKDGIIVYAKIVDNAGNITYLSSDVFETHGDAQRNFTTDVNIDSDVPITSDDLTVAQAKAALEHGDNALDGATLEAVRDEDNRVQVYLDIKNADMAEITANGDKELIGSVVAQNGAKEENIWTYLDISLWLRLQDNDPVRLYTTGESDMNLVYRLSNDLLLNKQGWRREYYLAEVHHPAGGGQPQTAYRRLDLNPEDNTFSFGVNKFSTYALFYHDYVNGGVNELHFVGASATLIGSEYVYTGKSITPKVNVFYTYQDYDAAGNRSGAQVKIKLEQNVDYTLEYVDNVNVGTGTVIIHGIGNYYMDIEKHFTIYKKSAQKWTLGAVPDLKMTGSDLRQTIEDSVTVNDGPLVVDPSDYDVLIEGDTTRPGNVKISVQPKQTLTCNYIGKPVKAFTTIRIVDGSSGLDLSNAEVTLKKPMEFVYKGVAYKPAVTVKLDGAVIKSNQYRIVYENNINASACTGKPARIRVFGTNTAYGEAQCEFEILPKEITTLKPVKLPGIYWRRSIDDIKPIIIFAGKYLQKDRDYLVEVQDISTDDIIGRLGNKIRPTATISIHPSPNNKNFIDSSPDGKGLVMNISVRPRTLSSGLTTKVIGKSINADGTLVPGVDVYYNNDILTEGVDYTVSYKRKVNKNNGVVFVTASVVGKGMYMGKRNAKFALTKK